MKKLQLILVAIISLILLILTVKGQPGNPVYFQSEKDIRVGGPFELSNGTSRYALTEAIVKDKTFYLNVDLAKFAAPDVVDYKGKFFTIFTPGISFLGVPFYLLGEYFGLPQVFAFFSITIFLILNIFLVARLATKFGAGFYASIVSGLAFAFATNALAYSLNYTQHTLSTTVVLLGILNATWERTLLRNILFGLIVGAGVLVDVPNLFLLMPAGIYILLKHFDLKQAAGKLKFSLSIKITGLLLGVIPLIAVFGWYNKATTGSYFKLAQAIGRVEHFNEALPSRNSVVGVSVETDTHNDKWLSLPFNPRDQLTGLYVLLLSNERSWLFYSPVLLLGFLGILEIYRKQQHEALLNIVVSALVLDIVTYSMFGDPWGGWAFGPRYLIPGAALLAAFLGVAVDRFRKNIIFIAFFVTLLFYSIFINLTGALTTNAVPPKIEAVNLGYKIPYTYKYNFQLIDKNFSSALVYNAFFSDKIPARFYLFALFLITSGLILAFYSLVLFSRRNKDLR